MVGRFGDAIFSKSSIARTEEDLHVSLKGVFGDKIFSVSRGVMVARGGRDLEKIGLDVALAVVFARSGGA